MANFARLMGRYFIELAYNGTAYHGWQVQDNAHTVQAEINNALSTIFQEKIEVTGCGRTDTGVHAREFFAHFDANFSVGDLKVLDYIYKINSLLPKDISVYNILPVRNEAHARFDAVERSYEFIISRKKDPFMIDRTMFFFRELDINAMNKAARILLNYEDFSCFSKAHTQVKTNNCKIRTAEWSSSGHLWKFSISADRFLRNMVRAIVGTLLEIGEGKLSPEGIRAIIESKDRRNAGASVPADGLYLVKVDYPKNIFLTDEC